MAPLFQWTPRDNSASVGTIAELIQRPAQIRADAARRTAATEAQATLQRGQIRGEMFGSLGQLASGVVQQYGQQQEQAKRGELLTQALDGLVSGKATLEQIMPALGAEDTQALVKAVQGYDDLMNGRQDRAREAVKNILPVIQPMAPEARQRYWTMPGGLREATIRGGLLTEQNAPPELTDEMLGEVARWVTVPEDAPKPVQVDTVDEQGHPVTRFETPTPGASFPKYQAPAKPPAPPAIGSFEDYVIRKYGENPTPDQITEARKVYQQADDRPPANINLSGMGALYGATDPKAIAEGIADGSLPPMLSEYGRVVQGAVATQLRKMGINLAQRQSEWRSVQRFYLAKQSTQQLRIRQSADVILQSVDEIDRLADEWSAGGFKALNKVTLEAAQHGALGPKAAELATLLDAQITETIEALANVYMGGNSPTERAMMLAERQLKSEWSHDVLRSATQLARKNTQFRLNAIESIGPSGVNPQSPYLMPSGQAGPAVSVAPSQGRQGGGGQPKVGDVVNIGGRRVRIRAIYPDGSFDGDEVR